MNSDKEKAGAGAPDVVSRGGTSKRGGVKQLASGSGPQWGHLHTIKNTAKALILAHPGLRIFVAVQSAYSQEVPVLVDNNLGKYAGQLKDVFMDACADLGERQLAVVLREELVKLADPQLVRRVAERLVELWTAEGVLGPWLASSMLKIAAGVPDDAGKKYLKQVGLGICVGGCLPACLPV